MLLGVGAERAKPRPLRRRRTSEQTEGFTASAENRPDRCLWLRGGGRPPGSDRCSPSLSTPPHCSRAIRPPSPPLPAAKRDWNGSAVIEARRRLRRGWRHTGVGVSFSRGGWKCLIYTNTDGSDRRTTEPPPPEDKRSPLMDPAGQRRHLCMRADVIMAKHEPPQGAEPTFRNTFFLVPR